MIQEAYNEAGVFLRGLNNMPRQLELPPSLESYAARFQALITPLVEQQPVTCGRPVKVIFPVIDPWNQYVGIMTLFSVMEQLGCDVCFVRGQCDDILRELVKDRINLLCYSVSAPTFAQYYRLHIQLLMRYGRRYQIRSVFGGPHATHYPEIAMLRYVDYVVRFDGEPALCELVRVLSSERCEEPISGVIHHMGNEILVGDGPILASSLDALPYANREAYLRVFGGNRHFAVAMASRGCIFNCRYCHNWLAHQTFDGDVRFFRRMSPRRFVEELKTIRDLGFKLIDISDDTFNCDFEWLEEWAHLYRREVALPFQCNVRADIVTEATTKVLQEAGCRSVSMGLELYDDEQMRRDLGRACTTEHIRAAVSLFRRTGIKIILTNMFACPGSTVDDDKDTVVANCDIRPDYAYSQAFQPYPGTGIPGSCGERNVQYYNHQCRMYLWSPVLNGPDARERRNLICLLQLAVTFPRFRGQVMQLARLPLDGLYRFLYRINLMYFKDRNIRRTPVHKTLIKCIRENFHITR